MLTSLSRSTRYIIAISMRYKYSMYLQGKIFNILRQGQFSFYHYTISCMLGVDAPLRQFSVLTDIIAYYITVCA